MMARAGHCFRQPSAGREVLWKSMIIHHTTQRVLHVVVIVLSYAVLRHFLVCDISHCVYTCKCASCCSVLFCFSLHSALVLSFFCGLKTVVGILCVQIQHPFSTPWNCLYTLYFWCKLNLKFATRWLCTLSMPFADAESIAACTFVSVWEWQVSLYKT